MLQVTHRALTRYDYANLPEFGPRFQLIEGELHMAPAPNRYHQDISRNLGWALLKYLDEHAIGVLYYAPFDVYLTDINVFQPDIIFVSKANAHILTDAGAEGAPDLVVEILSPKTARFDKEPKREIYARTGVTELWIIDPEPRTLSRFCLRENSETPAAVLRATEVFETPLFPGLRIALADVFKQ
jgi:Uma2 family endonuclease